MGKILPYHNRELQAEELKFTIKPQVAVKIRAIAEAEGTDADCQVMLAVTHLINRKWDWEKGKPRSRGER